MSTSRRQMGHYHSKHKQVTGHHVRRYKHLIWPMRRVITFQLGRPCHWRHVTLRHNQTPNDGIIILQSAIRTIN